uniref:phage tail tip fiber protein n=1 Tax=Aeromonas lacus TaxID=558884 RepID=UPI00126A454F
AMANTVQTVKADLTKLINEGDAKNTKDMQAAIAETKTALVEGDKVIAKSIQDVSTKVQGVEGKVQTQQQVIQDINGNLTAKYVASVDANGVFGGFELYGDAKTKTSKFVVVADDFIVVNPNNHSSKAVPFEVRDGITYLNNACVGNLDSSNIRAGGINAACIQAGAITAEKIAAGSITGDKIVANVQLQTPDLLMGSIRLNNGAAGFGKGLGPYGGWDSTWSTIIYADGTLCTNKINASAGTISNLNVQNCTIAQDCRVLGTLYADNIVGLPSGKSFGHGEFGVPRDGNWMTIAEHQIRSPQGRFNTNCQIVIRGAAGSYSGSQSGASFGSYIGIRVLLNGSQIYSEIVTQTPNTGWEYHTQGYSWASPPFNIGSNGGYLVLQITTVNWWRYSNSGVQYNWGANKNGNRDYNILSSSMQGYIYSAIDK